MSVEHKYRARNGDNNDKTEKIFVKFQFQHTLKTKTSSLPSTTKTFNLSVSLKVPAGTETASIASKKIHPYLFNFQKLDFKYQVGVWWNDLSSLFGAITQL